MTDFHLNKSSLLGVEMLQAFMKQISDNVALISVNVTASTFSLPQSLSLRLSAVRALQISPLPPTHNLMLPLVTSVLHTFIDDVLAK